MANHEHGFRAMLERSRRIEANHGYREPEKERPAGSKPLLAEKSRILQRYSTAVEKDIKQTHGVRASIGAIVDMSGPGNPIMASSDEYLELPKIGWPTVPILASSTTQAINSLPSSTKATSSPNVEEVYNWYEPDQEYDVEEGCKDDDDDDDDDGNNNDSVREFATRIRFGVPEVKPSPTGRGLHNNESYDPFDNEPSEPMHPSLQPSFNHPPSKPPSAHPSASAVPSKSQQSSKPSSHSPSKKSSKHSKKTAQTARSQSSHNKNVPESDDGNSSSDHEVSVSSSYYSSTTTPVWQDAYTFINDHFWAIVIVLALLVLLIGCLLGLISPTGSGSGSSSGSSSSSSSSSSGGGGGESTGKVIWHHGPVM